MSYHPTASGLPSSPHFSRTVPLCSACGYVALSTAVAVCVMGSFSLALQLGVLPGMDFVSTGYPAASQAILQMEVQTLRTTLMNFTEDLHGELRRDMRLMADELRRNVTQDINKVVEASREESYQRFDASSARAAAASKAAASALEKLLAKQADVIATVDALSNSTSDRYAKIARVLQQQTEAIQALRDKASSGGSERKSGGAVEGLVRESLWGFLTGGDNSSSADSER
eukprot:TRINITY_DN34_c1_g1_i1.p1 TRINITY_DN34_c1_g1~~TRINITY_DN34_c1_g1_i1.p1  ORF type:complete len:248 (+),score=42.29 TRINITY_DN34_c1_g1_i1:58-744(+)